MARSKIAAYAAHLKGKEKRMQVLMNEIKK